MKVSNKLLGIFLLLNVLIFSTKSIPIVWAIWFEYFHTYHINNGFFHNSYFIFFAWGISKSIIANQSDFLDYYLEYIGSYSSIIAYNYCVVILSFLCLIMVLLYIYYFIKDKSLDLVSILLYIFYVLLILVNLIFKFMISNIIAQNEQFSALRSRLDLGVPFYTLFIAIGFLYLSKSKKRKENSILSSRNSEEVINELINSRTYNSSKYILKHSIVSLICIGILKIFLSGLKNIGPLSFSLFFSDGVEFYYWGALIDGYLVLYANSLNVYYLNFLIWLTEIISGIALIYAAIKGGSIFQLKKILNVVLFIGFFSWLFNLIVIISQVISIGAMINLGFLIQTLILIGIYRINKKRFQKKESTKA